MAVQNATSAKASLLFAAKQLRSSSRSARLRGGDKATVRDVAESAGVSVATVSRVFNSPDAVKHATRVRVLESASSLDYSPNLSAVALSGYRRRSAAGKPSQTYRPRAKQSASDGEVLRAHRLKAVLEENERLKQLIQKCNGDV